MARQPTGSGKYGNLPNGRCPGADHFLITGRSLLDRLVSTQSVATVLAPSSFGSSAFKPLSGRLRAALLTLGLAAAFLVGAGTHAPGIIGHAYAATVDSDPWTQSAPSDSESSAPGGSGSTAALAQRQGGAVNPVGSPGSLPVAPGIAATITYIGESAGNPVGGLRQGSAFSGQVFGGLDFDLKRLAGIDGATIHFAMVQRHGDSDSALFIGNNTAVQEIYGLQKNRVTILTYQQTLFGGRVMFEFGRSGGNNAFLTSPLYCLFESNAICGSPVYIFQVSNFTAFPASGSMGRAKINLTDKVYVHGGAYAADPRNTAPREIGFNFSASTATGVTFPLEIGYGTNFSNDRLPRHYAVGVIYDASQRADPFLDASGRPAILTGAPYRMDFGRSILYGTFDQMIWRPDSESPRGLTIFGAAFFTTGGRVEQDHSFELGLVQLGTFRGRDRDTIGFAVNEKRFSSLFVANILAARTAAGGSPQIPREELMFELNYGYEASSALRLTPNLQYVLNPDQASRPSLTRNIPNAFVIGGRVTLDLSEVAKHPPL